MKGHGTNMANTNQRNQWKKIMTPGRIVYFLVILLSLYFVRGFAAQEVYPITLIGRTHVYLGLSVVEQDFSTVLRDIDENAKQNGSDLLTSYLLQSPQPAALIYLDYITYAKDKTLPEKICFKTITVARNNVPIDLAPEIRLSGVVDESGKYKYTFPENRCVEQDKKYIMPHVLLAVLPVDASANFLWQDIQGFRAADYFPFDRQNIKLDLLVGTDTFNFSPSLEVVVAQKGWRGSLKIDEEKHPNLKLDRFDFYTYIPIAFFIIMAIIIPLINNVVDDAGGFFEVAFGLLLGLWGTHEILIPDYIRTSIPIDMLIYILYILVILEILIILLPELLKKTLTIRLYEPDTENERVAIESWSPIWVNISDCFICDHSANHQYKFAPDTKARVGGWWLLRRKIIIWTWKQKKSEMHTNRQTTNLFWNRGHAIWNRDLDTVHLRDHNENIITTYSSSNETLEEDEVITNPDLAQGSNTL